MDLLITLAASAQDRRAPLKSLCLGNVDKTASKKGSPVVEPCEVGVWVDMVVAVMGPGHRHRLMVQLLAGEATRGGRQLLQVPKVSLSRELGDQPS